MIEIKNLTLQYGEKKILEDITLTLQDGEKLALMGENGAGKTTLLHAVAGLVADCTGEILIDGEASTGKDVNRKCGLLFQNPDDQIFMPTVWQDIYFGAKNSCASEAEAEEKTEAVIKKYGLEELQHRSVYELSGGEKRMLTLAGAMVMEPEYLLLDEPSSYLDMRSKRRLVKELSSLPQSMILVTHDISEAQALCTRAAVLKKGRLLKITETKKLTEDEELLRELGYID